MKQTDAFPTPPRNTRTTFSLPIETAERITRLSRRMGVSQSAFVAELLAEPLAAMASIMDALPETGATAQDVKRARGRSVDFIKNVIGEALEAVADLAGAAPAQPRSRRAARGRVAQHPSTLSQLDRQGKASAVEATADDSGRDVAAAARPRRGGRPSHRTVAPSRPRKTSGRHVKRGRTKR